MKLYRFLFFILSSNVFLQISSSMPIIGGHIVSSMTGYDLKYSFMVSLHDISKTGNQEHFCGGSLLNPKWILTAAHCLFNKNLSTIVAYIGYNDISTHGSESVYHRIDHIEYTDFQPTTYHNDIALLRLEKFYFPLGKKFQMAQLPKYGMRPNRNRACNVIGYGVMDHFGKVSTKLMEAEVYVITRKKCSMKIGHVWAPRKHDNTICVMGEKQDACQGDSGGPLLCSYGGQQYIYGIVSRGIVCGGQNVPSLYTVTVPYLNWIQTIIQS